MYGKVLSTYFLLLFPLVRSVGCTPGTFQSFAVEQLDTSTTLAYPTPAPCPLGHYQPNPSQIQCLPCPVGTFTPLLHQTSCQICPVAEYQDEEGQVVCKKCPDGYTTDGEGSTNFSSCVCVGASCPCEGVFCVSPAAHASHKPAQAAYIRCMTYTVH